MDNCKCCEENQDGLCGRYGRLVEDGDVCCPIINVRCSWCGQRTILKSLEKAESRFEEYRFYCKTCKAVRFFRPVDIM